MNRTSLLTASAAALNYGEYVWDKYKLGDFFAIWKDADPNVPVLLQAKAEYTKLQ